MSGRKRTISRVYTSSTQPVPASYSVKKSRPTKKSSKSKMVSGLGNKNILMPYHQVNVVSGNSAIVHATVIRANSLFDPDFSLGGEQPLGYDQYAALYKKYYVKGVKATVDFYAYAESGVMPNDMMCFVWCDTDESTPTTGKGLFERCVVKGGKYLRPNNIYAAGPQSKISVKATTKGVTDHGFEDPDLSSDVGASPPRQWYIHVAWFGQATNLPAARTVMQNVVVLYDAVFYDAQPLPTS